MKKLFFISLIVTVAISGAFAHSFMPYLYSPGSTIPDIECLGGPITCPQIYGINTAYTEAYPNQDSSNNVDLSMLTSEEL